MGGGNRGNRGKRGSFAVNRPGAPQLVTQSGLGQRSFLLKTKNLHAATAYNLSYIKQKDPHNVIFLGSQQIQLREKLEKDTAKIAAESIVQVLSISFPVLGIIYMLYKVVIFIYPIIKAGLVTYGETGSEDKAVERMANETIKQGAKTIISTYAGTIAGAAASSVSEMLRVTVGNTTYEVVEAITSNATETILDESEDELKNHNNKL